MENNPPAPQQRRSRDAFLLLCWKLVGLERVPSVLYGTKFGGRFKPFSSSVHLHIWGGPSAPLLSPPPEFSPLPEQSAFIGSQGKYILWQRSQQDANPRRLPCRFIFSSIYWQVILTLGPARAQQATLPSTACSLLSVGYRWKLLHRPKKTILGQGVVCVGLTGVWINVTINQCIYKSYESPENSMRWKEDLSEYKTGPTITPGLPRSAEKVAP